MKISYARTMTKTPFLTFPRTRTCCELLRDPNCNVSIIYQLKEQ